MNGYLIKFLIVASCCQLRGQGLMPFAGSMQSGSPAAFAADTGTWAILLNPAGLKTSRSSIVTGTEQKFGISNLQSSAMALNHRGWGIAYVQGGQEEFKTFCGSLGYGHQLGSFDVGVTFIHSTVQQGIWGENLFQSGVALGAATSYKNTRIGYFIRNIGSQFEHPRWISAPMEHGASVLWQSQPIAIRAGLHLAGTHPPTTALALSMNLSNRATIVGGWSANPQTWSMAMSVNFRDFHFQMGTWWHDRLGFSPSFSLGYDW
jgi:hypothetical protein